LDKSAEHSSTRDVELAPVAGVTVSALQRDGFAVLTT